LISGLDRAPAALDAEVALATRDATLLVEAEIKAETPRVTGRLFSSITSSVRVLGGFVEGLVRTNVSYARYVEYGRGPVEAVNAKALRFRAGGGFIFRRRVGPAAGRFMFRKGAERALPAVRLLFRRAVQNTLRIAKGA
jgi:hypothetical protein